MPRTIPESAELLVSPKILPHSWSDELVVSGEYEHTKPLPDAEYRFEVVSTFFYSASDRRKLPITGTVRAGADGTVRIPFNPDIDGEWILTVSSEDDKRKNIPFTLALYVLPEELESYRPYVGEFHSHSTSSDGRQEPAYPPMRARTFGFDFYTLTDHWCYESSQRMIDEVGKTLGSMVLFNGEEMHPEREVLIGTDGVSPHYHHYHYVAIGHRASVRDAFIDGGETTQREVAAIAAELTARGVDPTVDLVPYAEGVWKLRKAKELGGLTLFAHPFWANPVNLDAGSIAQTFADREFDAVEAISVADDSSYMANKLLELRGDSEPVPVVGVSDSHNWQETMLCKTCTVVFAAEPARGAILDAVREGRSVACRMTDPLELVGPFRLVDYTSFYLQRILPLRRRIMSIQGNLALSRLRGGAFSQSLVDSFEKDLTALDRSIWRRT